MTTDRLTVNLTFNLQQQAYQHWMAERYEKASECYEEAIESEPENKSNYWYLGLMLLLLEKEEEAQTTWLWAMADGDAEQIEKWSVELIEILATEANRQVGMQKYRVAWAIRQHIRGVNPEDINNLLHLIDLSIQLEFYTGKELTEWGILELLKAYPHLDVNQDLLISVWERTLKYAPLLPSSRDLTEAMVGRIQKDEIIEKFVSNIIRLSYELAYIIDRPSRAIDFCTVGLEVAPKNSRLLETLATFCTETGEYTKALEYARLGYSVVKTLPEQLYHSQVILRTMINAGGYWNELASTIEQHKLLIGTIIDERPMNLGISDFGIGLYTTPFYFSYIQDNPQTNLKLRQQIGMLCQQNIEIVCKEEVNRYSQRATAIKTATNSSKRPLKIGYISSCFRRHSVGWLARSLLRHHDRDKFKIHTYMIASRMIRDPIKQSYIAYSDKSHQYGLVEMNVAEQIYEDEIDILIDLDSLTLNSICGILALKPASVQATWLGWDASEVPTIDYYIADPYILPKDAQEYYRETIWRLPQTFLAVDGFEVDVRTITRADLKIPDDAVVYLGAQRGPKYNPKIAKLQMQIISEVPKSYYIIKGFGEQDSLNRFFYEIAEEEGIARDRIKFIPRVKLEETHRANLQIADIVLDTYPYNGATTTMETLWMEIPMVTRVGQQFAARNSYTMMVNAGITEGIAWSDEEYVEWGIRLGKDEKLRQEISWKLRKSKQTAPLWNGKQFAREMEKAYEQMWQRYIDGGN